MLIETLNLKTRPKKWKDVVGQDKTVARLQNIIKSEKIPKAMLFIGETGTGKTTLAYLFATYLNKGNASDIVHINGGGNEGKVEATRELIQTSRFKSLTSDYKIFIIDEAQELTKASVNTFLTPLEEDKGLNSIFIFCSMSPEKLDKAFFDRCSVFKLDLLTDESLVKRLMRVAKKEKFSWLDEKYAKLIAKNSMGSARNAVSQLESIAQLVDGIKDKKELKEELKTAIENLAGDDETDNAQKLLSSIYYGKADKFQEAMLSVNNLVSMLGLMTQLNTHCLNKVLAPKHKNISRWPLLNEFFDTINKRSKVPDVTKLMQIQEDIHNAKQSIINHVSDPYSVAVTNFRKYFKGNKK